MNPLDYCERAVAEPGASVYYAAWTLGTNIEARQHFLARMALAKALRECAEADLDTAAALAKVGFWADELGALLTGDPTHPVAQALRPGLGSGDASLSATAPVLEEAVRATGEVVELLPAEDLALAERLAMGTCGDLLAMSQEGTTRHAGAAHQLAERLVRMAHDRAAWRLLPEAARIRDPHGKHEDALRSYVADSCVSVISHADTALADNTLPRPARALARIARSTAQRITSGGHDVLARRVDLMPVHKLWLAWR